MSSRSSMVFGIALVAAGVALQAQEPQSLRQTLRSLSADPAVESFVPPQSGTIKCGTPYIVSIHSQWNSMAPMSRNRLMSILQRPALQTSRLTPSGRFRIHYDTVAYIDPNTGNFVNNVPALLDSIGQRIPNTAEAYVDSVAAILDHVWAIEIDSLGYDPPPPDGNQGGGPEYDVHIKELGKDDFGYTDWLDSDAIPTPTNTRYATFMVVDNDFYLHRTQGIDGLKVTCAHEFHHAIQMGAYGFWTESDFYFNELTSSWMEDVVYTEVNDYYFDVALYFSTAKGFGYRDPQGYPWSFTYYNVNSYRGYERSIWGHYLAKRFGRAMMKEIWTGIRTERCLPSMRDVFARHGTDWSAEFSLFTYWNYFTADRADTVHYYPEGNHYPRFDPTFLIDFSGNTSAIISGAYPLSSSMFEFHIPQDTLTAIVANIDVDAAMAGNNAIRQVEVELTKGVVSAPHVKLANGFTAAISTADVNVWRPFYVIASTNGPIERLQLQPSPNPFRPAESAQLLLPVDSQAGSRANVYVLSSSLTLALSGTYVVQNQFGNQFIAVPSSEIASHCSSGVYVVIAKIAGNEYQWKVAVIR